VQHPPLTAATGQELRLSGGLPGRCPNERTAGGSKRCKVLQVPGQDRTPRTQACGTSPRAARPRPSCPRLPLRVRPPCRRGPVAGVGRLPSQRCRHLPARNRSTQHRRAPRWRATVIERHPRSSTSDYAPPSSRKQSPLGESDLREPAALGGVVLGDTVPEDSLGARPHGHAASVRRVVDDGPWCDQCGGAASGDHRGCADRRHLEPPRYCAVCRRRMVVQVLPRGWSARCVQHGTRTG
jgi:hypothetical protein